MGAKYDQLDLDERIKMSRLYEVGHSVREIGRMMGRSASTIGREQSKEPRRHSAIGDQLASHS